MKSAALKSAALRLDSFSAGMTLPGPKPGPAAEREAAFQQGLEQGLNQGRETSLDALTGALADLREQLTAADDFAATIRREATENLAPVLAGIVDLLAARSDKERLCQALMAELQRLNDAASPRKLRIRCPANLRPDIAQCLERAGLSDARIEEIASDRPVAELVAGNSSISFDPQQAVEALHSIINDIMAED